MGPWEAFGAVDGEKLGIGDGGVLGGPADVVAGDTEVRVLRVEVVRVAQ